MDPSKWWSSRAMLFASSSRFLSSNPLPASGRTHPGRSAKTRSVHSLPTTRNLVVSSRSGGVGVPPHPILAASASRFSTQSNPLPAKNKSGGKPNKESNASKYPSLPQGWQAVIGVECHAQIKDAHKLFSGASPPHALSPPNTLVTPFDASHPGTLPRLNRSALRKAVKASLALGCHVREKSTFDRKHYFYADLPAGYQITQKYAPLAHSGKLHLSFEEGNLPRPEDEVTVEILQLQLEQDTAKSTHFETGTESATDVHSIGKRVTSKTYVDLNRAGTGLMEIVSGAQMRTPEQAGAYVRKLQELLRCVGASDGNMQEGSLRCDVNVSVNRVGEGFGTRCEVKNLNSVRFMMNAIAYESHRQVKLLEEGGKVEQETRGYDEARQATFKMRGKEDSPDYRYMPDPNLAPIRITKDELERIRETLPELPDAKRSRLKEQYGLTTRDVNVLMRVGQEDEGSGRVVVVGKEGGNDAVEYFEKVVRGKVKDAQTCMNWIINELMKGLNAENLAFSEDHFPPDRMAQLVSLVEEGTVTGTTAKRFLAEQIKARSEMIRNGDLEEEIKISVLETLRQRNLLALRTYEELEPLCRNVMSQLEQEVRLYRSGKVKLFGKIFGEAVKISNARADVQVLDRILRELLDGERDSK